MQIQMTEKFFNTLKQISAIAPSVLVSKEQAVDEKGTATKVIRVGTKNLAKSFFLNLEVPETEFTFQGDSLGFTDFKEFISIYTAFEDATLAQDPNDPTSIEVIKMSTKIKYKLADTTTLPAWFEIPEYEKKDSVVLTAEDLAHILKTFSITNTSLLNATVNGSKLELGYSGDSSLHTAQDYLNLEQDSTDGTYAITLSKEVLSLIPKGTFKLFLNKDENHVQMELVDAEYKMRLALQSMID